MTRTAVNPTLIAAACAGDTAAIETMLLLYQPLVVRFARKYCATPEDVEDAVQETLWIAARKIGTLRVTVAFASWLFHVVKNQCFRLQPPAYLTGVDVLLYEEDGQRRCEVLDENDIEDGVLLRHDVINALAKLPAAYRQVVVMRDIQNLSAPEVADTLKLSIETVKSRLHRGRTLMREQLSAWAS